MSNKEWIDFLCEQWNISRTSAKEMLHRMMNVKKEDNFKKQFSGNNNMTKENMDDYVACIDAFKQYVLSRKRTDDKRR